MAGEWHARGLVVRATVAPFEPPAPICGVVPDVRAVGRWRDVLVVVRRPGERSTLLGLAQRIALCDWAAARPHRELHWIVVGAGARLSAAASSEISWRGRLPPPASDRPAQALARRPRASHTRSSESR